MKEIQLTKKPVELKSLKNDEKDNHYDLLLCGDFLAYEGDNLKFVYITSVGIDTQRYIDTINRMTFLKKQTRSMGMKTHNRTIGYLPRNHYRRDYCSVSRMAIDEPLEHDIVCELALDVDRKYKEYFQDTYSAHQRKSLEILPELHIDNTVFTSGIINKSIALDYHYDKGNIPNVLSGMVTLKQDVSGGYLVFPEYEIAIECANDSIFLFDGQGIIHGVSDIHKLNEKGNRYTVVFYSMLKMWECLPIEQELDRIRALETTHELEKVNAI